VKILAWVVPGGGKSRLPGILAKRFKNFYIAWFVPRLSLREQAAQALLDDFGIRVMESESEINPSKGERGFVATMQALMTQPDLWAQELERKPYMLVMDEIHHAKVSLTGESNQYAQAIDRLDYVIRLDMTGTLETNDNTMIHGITYSNGGFGISANPVESADYFIRYDRSSALLEKAIVPIEFQHHDGAVRYADKNGTQDVPRLSQIAREAESKGIFTALNSGMAAELFGRGVQHWRAHGEGTNKQLIVVTDSQSNAKKYHKLLLAQGITAAMAITDNNEAHKQVKAFRRQEMKALVTCQMAYEGLDAPRASHLICLTHIRSVPWIEQMLGRVWRFAPDKPLCWVFVPDDPRMARVIDRIRTEQITALRPPGEGPGPGGDRDVVVPLHSELEVVTKSNLDGPVNTIRNELLDFLAKWGFDGSEPAVEQLLAEAERKAMSIPAAQTTPAAERKHIRDSIAAACRRADSEKGEDFGTHQDRLIRRTGKSIADMTVEELQRASVICANVCA
jgi:superfamily II DNA or RNA helicase